MITTSLPLLVALLSRQLSQLNLSNIQALVIIYLSNNDGEVFKRDLEKEFGVSNPTMAVYAEVEAMCDSILTNGEKVQFIKLTNKLTDGLKDYQNKQ